jgi:hypothetical protein
LVLGSWFLVFGFYVGASIHPEASSGHSAAFAYVIEVRGFE